MSDDATQKKRLAGFVAQAMTSCVHFHGIQHETCDAGVRLLDVRDASQPGPYRWPCVTLMPGNDATTVCDKRRFPTREEAEITERALIERIDAFHDKLKSGICPDCNAKVERERQVGPCVYADPCGHRLYQGTARK